MTNKGYLLGAASLLLLASCAELNPAADRMATQSTAKPAAAMGPYSPAEFKILLEKTLRPLDKQVAARCQPSAGTCAVAVDVDASCHFTVTPDILSVPRGVSVVWQLSPGWTFKPNGIEFKNPGSAFAGHGNPSGRIYFWDVDPNAAPGYYGYWIHVTDGSHNCDFDPGIWI